jgi:cell wall-associated NlpC family hydrolase
MHRVIFLSILSLVLLITGCASSPRAGDRAAFPTPSDEQASDIAIHAMGLVGTPYRYGGNTPDSGFDCSGLIGYVYKARAGMAPPRTVVQLAGFGESIGSEEARTGDLVIFGGSRPFHAGIFVGDGRFVHAPSTGGRVRLDRLDNPYWQRQSPYFRRP